MSFVWKQISVYIQGYKFPLLVLDPGQASPTSSLMIDRSWHLALHYCHLLELVTSYSVRFFQIFPSTVPVLICLYVFPSTNKHMFYRFWNLTMLPKAADSGSQSLYLRGAARQHWGLQCPWLNVIGHRCCQVTGQTFFFHAETGTLVFLCVRPLKALNVDWTTIFRPLL